MRKSLIAAILTLGLGGAATAAVVAGNTDPAPEPRSPVLLAEAASPTPNTVRHARPMPGAADRAARGGDFCDEAYARAAGRFAYLEARLNLSGAQIAAFERWRDLRLATAKRRSAECGARPEPQPGARAMTRPNPVERLAREEDRLQRRLADIQAERPALQALYDSLNAGQRQILARGAGRGGLRHFGFGRGPGMEGPRGGMMMHRPPMDRPDAPPPAR